LRFVRFRDFRIGDIHPTIVLQEENLAAWQIISSCRTRVGSYLKESIHP
jgi:hypothetical protein